MISIYKKEDNQVFKSKVKKWRLKFVYKNLKGLDCQPDQSLQSDKLKLPKWVVDDVNAIFKAKITKN